MKKSFITLLSLLFLVTQLTSLQAQRTCSHESHTNSLMQNHEYAAQHQARQNNFQIVHQNNPNLERAQCANPVTLPMAVHFQGLSAGYDEACLTALAQDQIRILNEDYGGYNADISDWANASQYYPGVSNGETCIAFCLATQSHPSGFGLSSGDLAVTFNTVSGDFNANWANYINIFVIPNLTSGGQVVLGYSPLGGSGNGDGVAINANAFGSGAGCTGVVPGAPYNLGRTLTHELGHYLNLDHVWGGNGGCNSDDNVADTPNQQSPNYSCPTLGNTSSCSSEDMHMSYMDYTNDACMYMFSAGQSTRMENYVTANLQNVANNYATVCDAAPATCTDGLQNGDETGIDCGGANCPDCPTCSDGIQNGDETGVDCGGASCATCPCTNGTEVTLSILFDSYPDEISWTLTDANGNTIDSQVYLDNTFANQTDTRTYCLPYDCYVFTINDSYGDGLDDSQSIGNYTLVDDAGNTLGTASGNFGSSSTANFCLTGSPSSGIYVDQSATGSNDGSDWANAFTDLQDALAIGANETIHIAEGIYLPTSGTVRGKSFEIPGGATVLGGYSTGGGTRDPKSNTTTLSGEIDGVSDLTGNSYHVVKLQNVTGVTLDGLDIKDGNADDASSFGRARGGGIYSVGSSSIISNTTLRRNKAVFGGAIFATTSASIELNNCIIKLNTAGNGSAIYHSNQTNMVLNACYIVDNNSTTRCALEINNSSSTEINNTVIANNASANANALGFIATNRNQTCNIYNSTILGETKNKALISLQVGFNDVLDVNIYNSIIAHQTASFNKTAVAFNNGTLNFNTYNCYVQGSTILGTASANLYENTAGAVTYGTNYTPDSCSPTVDAGNNGNLNSLTMDFDGNDRTVGTVDIGAHEAQTPCGTARESINADLSIFPNPTSGMVFLKTDLETFDVKVYDILGKIIAQSNTKEIDLSHLPLGIYVMNVESNGTIVKTEKIVKK